MFEVDPERSWVDPALGGITSLIQSLNTPLVAAGQHPAENVQSWILTRSGNGGAVEVFVYFHLTESNQAVLYRWDGGPVPSSNQEQVVEEAMGFCESMGFMMDNLNFGQLPPDKRGELLQTLPPFLQDLSNLAGKDLDEMPLTMAKKVVDPVEEFAKARAAAAGQPTANDFADPGSGVDSFDPMSLMEDVGAPADRGDGMQIEITEIEGLELMPAADGGRAVAAPVTSRVESSVRELDLDDDEPPLVVGSASIPAVKPASAPPLAPTSAGGPPPAARTPSPSQVAPAARAPSPSQVAPAAAPAAPAAAAAPIVRGRERTPPGEVTIFDDASSAPQPVPKAAAPAPAPAPPAAPSKPMAAAPAKPAVAVEEDEFNVDDLLGDLDVGSVPAKPNGNGAEKPAAAAASSLDVDVSSALDDILDGVESSKSPAKPAAPAAVPAAAPAPVAAKDDDIGIDIDLDGLGGSMEASMEASISSPDEALVALEALGIGDDPIGIPSLDDEPVKPAAPAPAKPATSSPPPVRPAVEAAWAGEATQAKANANGHSGNGAAPAAVKLDITTDDLARLLSML